MKRSGLVLILTTVAACASSTSGGSPDGGSPSDHSSDLAPVSAPDLGVAPGSDLSTPSDAGAVGVVCAGTPCLGGQLCMNQLCTFPCVGVMVPGDYATVQSAFDALGPVGGTICLQAGTFADVTALPTKDITLIGVSPDRSIMGHLVIETNDRPNPAHVVLRGVGFADGIRAVNENLSIEGCRVALAPSSSNNAALEIDVLDASPFVVTIDGSDIRGISSSSGGALFIIDDYNDVNAEQGPHQVMWSVAVTNSYLHDAMAGVWLAPSGSYSTVTPTVTILNDTFQSSGEGLMTVLGGDNTGGAVALTFVNNLFLSNGIAIDVNGVNTTIVKHANDAFFGNTTTFAGAATPGGGDVHADPLVVAGSVPPSPAAGSPLAGAGDASSAPQTDWYGRSRAARVDIGAVQAP